MTNKEIKVGSKIWIDSPFIRNGDYYVVSSVKKEKTLVTVVVDVPENYYHKAYQITMYGHASSMILSGFDGKCRYKDIPYTCDYSLVEEKTLRYERDEKLIKAGRSFLNIVEFFK